MLKALPDTDLVGTATGQLFAWDASEGKFVALSVPADNSFPVADSGATGGWGFSTFATRAAFKVDTVVAAAVTIDGTGRPNHRIVLPNGATAVTLEHLEPGTTYKVKFVQPASGAAGTITLAGEGYTFTPSSVLLSATNGKHNIVTFTYDSEDGKVSVTVSEEFT